MRVHWYCLCDRDYCYFSGSNHQRACSRWALLICTIVGWWTFSSTFCNRRNKARTSDRPPGIRTRELKHGGDGCWHPLFPTFSARRVYEIFAVFKVLSFSTFRGFGVVFKTSVNARLLHTGKSGLRGWCWKHDSVSWGIDQICIEITWLLVHGWGGVVPGELGGLINFSSILLKNDLTKQIKEVAYY